MLWQTSRRRLCIDRPLVMAILNVTPDSFSDGGRYASLDEAIQQVEKLLGDGADIIDVGGESTRPGSTPISIDEEISRTVPVVEAIARQFDIPVSIDTTKSEVARRAIDAGAEIVNDISGLRFDQQIAEIAAASKAGLVLTHSRGSLETLHSQPPVDNILADVTANFQRGIDIAHAHGVSHDQMALDIGLGFGKTLEQNLELIAKLGKIVAEFKAFPMLVGASRKSFIGKILGDLPPDERFGGSLAAAVIAVMNGANIVRVHDVKETVAAIKVAVSITAKHGTQE